MLAVRIRRADSNDIPGLMRIEAECFGPEKFSEETVRAFVVRDDTFVLVALRENDIIGSAMCLVSEVDAEGRIASIAVLKEHRCIGVGSDLLEECEHEFRNRKLTKYSLEVDITNESAIAMYTSSGYRITGLIPDFYGAGRDAYWMKKSASTGKTRIKVRSA
jgi:ribosomal protein S18 acetylase RimI-like enzyme